MQQQRLAQRRLNSPDANTFAAASVTGIRGRKQRHQRIGVLADGNINRKDRKHRGLKTGRVLKKAASFPFNYRSASMGQSRCEI